MFIQSFPRWAGGKKENLFSYSYSSIRVSGMELPGPPQEDLVVGWLPPYVQHQQLALQPSPCWNVVASFQEAFIAASTQIGQTTWSWSVGLKLFSQSRQTFVISAISSPPSRRAACGVLVYPVDGGDAARGWRSAGGITRLVSLWRLIHTRAPRSRSVPVGPAENTIPTAV